MPQPRKSTFEQSYIDIIDRLIARRLELDMSQAELGQAYGEDQSFVSRIERRQHRLDVWEFVQFCHILETDPSEILVGIK